MDASAPPAPVRWNGESGALKCPRCMLSTLHMNLGTTIVTLSIILQSISAVIALRQVRLTRHATAWLLIATAISLMAVRRCVSIYHVIVGNTTHPPDLVAELLALTISVLMLLGIFGIGRLFRSIQEAQEERRKLDAKLQASERLESIGLLAGGMAHDLNNMLMGIVGNAEVLQACPNQSPDNQECTRQILGTAEKVSQLCHKMLMLSGRSHPTLESVELNALTAGSLDLLGPNILRDLNFSCELAEAPMHVLGDPIQLHQVVLNLVTNASEALGEKTTKKTASRIRVKTGILSAAEFEGGEHNYISPSAEHSQLAYLEVGDNGCGMARGVQDKLFEPFFSTKFKGRGLGMAASLGIIKAHGGALQVYSSAGRGTTIRVLLPAAAAPLLGPQLEAKESIYILPTAHHNVLVVDDEQPIRAITTEHLATLQYDVTTACDGIEALQQLKAKPIEFFSLVVLDINMPILDGFGTLRALRITHPELPVLLISGGNLSPGAGGERGLQFQHFLRKPFRRKAFLEAVQKTRQRGIEQAGRAAHGAPFAAASAPQSP